jgi:hypothetical protein
MFVSTCADRVEVNSLSTPLTDRAEKLAVRFMERLGGGPPTLLELDIWDDDLISRLVREVLGGGLDDLVRLTDRGRVTCVRLVDRDRCVTGGRLLLVDRDLAFVVEDDAIGCPPQVVPVTATTLSLRDVLEDLLRLDVVLPPPMGGVLLDDRR